MVKGVFSLSEFEDGSIRVSYEDYDVEFLGGSDYEAIYSLDAENAEKLRTFLSQNNKGSLEEMIETEFGVHLDKKSFAETCDENGIKYELFTWP